jgi:hypothetical protein
MLRRPYPVGQEPWRLLPKPRYDEVTRKYVPMWKSVALFYNLDGTSANMPTGYVNTTVNIARDFLDEGTIRGDPTMSEFLCNYWATLSYGEFGFGLDTPRDASGQPLIPDISLPAGTTADSWAPINSCIDANAEAIWRAAGSLQKEGRRWIPSIVLVQNFEAATVAAWTGSVRRVGNEDYEIGDNIRIRYNIDFVNSSPGTTVPAVPPNVRVRDILGTLCHEYAHNFFEFDDLYGPAGCTGYWDLLGDNSPPGNMSEVCSVHKDLIGWLSLQVITGPVVSPRTLSLRPYTRTGDAIKVVPDPENNPSEYFILEYRKSTSDRLWTPDRALPEEGLLIVHINERLGGPPDTWLMRDAAYFDPEFADYSDNGRSLYTGFLRLRGVLFPYSFTVSVFDENTGQTLDETVVKNSFTPTTQPSSNFYGGRPSGVSITNIRVSNSQLYFQLAIDCQTRVGWTVSNRDRCVAGRFTLESLNRGQQEIFCRNPSAVGLLQLREVQWFVLNRYDDQVDGWTLRPDNAEFIGDFDGDGRDEVFMRSSNSAGILKWQGTVCRLLTREQDRIGGWTFDFYDRQLPADLDGDGRDEILIRTGNERLANKAGVIKMDNNGRLQLVSIQEDEIDGWRLAPTDKAWAGFFTQTGYKEILIRSSEWLGLLYWNTNDRRLRIRHAVHDQIDGWRLNEGDQHCIGDFDGDGRDEIYIRSPQYVGVLKWMGNSFKAQWIRQSNIQYASGNQTLPLTGGDTSYSGRFLRNRDGILHRAENGVAILTWESGEMRVRRFKDSGFTNGTSGVRDLWTLRSADKFVLGDFHRNNRVHPHPDLAYIQDELTDVFMHNGSGTGMFGFDRPSSNPAQPSYGEADEIGLLWINRANILFGPDAP